MATDPQAARTQEVVTQPPARAVDRRAVDREARVEIPPTLNLGRDRVRWGAVLAGVVTALTSLLLLSLLGIALGLTTVNAGTAAAQGAPPPDLGRNLGLWGAVAALISFLIGGFVAGRVAAVFDRSWGALNGALVFLLGLPLMLWLAAQGLGFVLGAFAQSVNLGAPDVGAAMNQAQQAAQQVPPTEVARTAESVRNAAWTVLGVSLLGLIAGALGGYLGTRRELELDRATGRVHE